ncbi:MAG: TlyA family RNA methyltransferase [Hyphomicrobiales bacterium]|nr:MAG: TlyA family RNA methyltransferase [Hyphomicrobiales bacterium]
MVLRGMVATRSRAQDLIRRGLVTVGGAVETGPARAVGLDDAIVLAGGDNRASHVSRGAEKLGAALNAFGFEVSGRVALDVGASTGGFTQTLLAGDATKVYAIDVGHAQLHPSLASDPRVISREGRDARSLTRDDIPEPVAAIVIDVSFISLTKVLPAVLALAAPEAWLIALVKPQFEVGRAWVGKGGIVRDADARQSAVTGIETFIGDQPGWRVSGTIQSPITGGSGNIEYLIGAVRHVP